MPRFFICRKDVVDHQGIPIGKEGECIELDLNSSDLKTAKVAVSIYQLNGASQAFYEVEAPRDQSPKKAKKAKKAKKKDTYETREMRSSAGDNEEATS